MRRGGQSVKSPHHAGVMRLRAFTLAEISRTERQGIPFSRRLLWQMVRASGGDICAERMNQILGCGGQISCPAIRRPADWPSSFDTCTNIASKAANTARLAFCPAGVVEKAIYWSSSLSLSG